MSTQTDPTTPGPTPNRYRRLRRIALHRSAWLGAPLATVAVFAALAPKYPTFQGD